MILSIITSSSLDIVLFDLLTEAAPAVQGVIRICDLVLGHPRHCPHVGFHPLPLKIRDRNRAQVDGQILFDDIVVYQVLLQFCLDSGLLNSRLLLLRIALEHPPKCELTGIELVD